MIPQVPDIESQLLGAFLVSRESLDVVDQLSKEDFYNGWNIDVFEAVRDLVGQNKHVDIITVENLLRERGSKDLLDNYYLADLTREATPRYEEYAEILRETALKRKLLTAGQSLVERSITDESVYSLVDYIETTINDYQGSGLECSSFTPDEIYEREKNKPKSERIYTGQSKLDLGIYGQAGSFRGQVEVTLADSGHGKTHWALFINGLRAKQGFKIHWFQLEDYDVNTANYFRSNIPDYLENILICDSLDDIESIKRESRKFKKEFGTDVIVVDYVQNVECSQRYTMDKVEYVSKELRKLAKSLNVVVHETSQITIADVSRKGWKLEPRDNDARWSKQLKQDAHLMTSIFRPNKVDDLIVSNTLTNQVKDWQGLEHPFNSVWARQVKVRGNQELKRLHMIHTDKGLGLYEGNLMDINT